MPKDKPAPAKRHPKISVPRRVTNGLVQQFNFCKQLGMNDRHSLASVAQRMLRIVSLVAVKRDRDEMSCSICSESIKVKPGEPYYLDHTEDCPLSWIEPIRL